MFLLGLVYGACVAILRLCGCIAECECLGFAALVVGLNRGLCFCGWCLVWWRNDCGIGFDDLLVFRLWFAVVYSFAFWVIFWCFGLGFWLLYFGLCGGLVAGCLLMFAVCCFVIGVLFALCLVWWVD